ncbi:hypothetical protein AB0F81_14505 [Actinoplanes sp. NPDC024001]|uniref:hypothetical protein n=1 Tax=Actinoplanes sp. NPDC024001 TaxID=3154598 RepID=UPI0034093ED2
MLRSVEVTAVLAVDGLPFHNLHWQRSFELSLDCFICERTGRTTSLKHGAEHGTCTGDSKTGTHPTATRISAFDAYSSSIGPSCGQWSTIGGLLSTTPSATRRPKP